MERTNPITCKTTKSPATAQICKDKISCVTQWRKDVHRWLNCQLDCKSTDQFEMSWECLSQGVSTARVVDVAWVKSHLLKTFLVFFNKMLKTDLKLNIIYQSWVASDDCQDKRCILQKCRRSPHSRERETCNRKGAPENQYIYFLLFLLILTFAFSCASTQGESSQSVNDSAPQQRRLLWRGGGDKCKWGEREMIGGKHKGWTWSFSKPTCRWLSPWLATESFPKSWMKILTPLTTLSCVPSLWSKCVNSHSQKLFLQPVQYSSCCKTKLQEEGDCEKNGVGSK